MKKPPPIQITVPHPWRWIGRLFVAAGTIIALVAVWALATTPDKMDDIEILNAITLVILLPIIIVLFLPFFIGKYPPWAVRIFGEAFLYRLIKDCRRLLGAQRSNQAAWNEPLRWLHDQRLVWLIIVFSAIGLGIWCALIY